MCYATVAMSTDYDCWHADEDDVSVSNVLEIMRANVAHAQRMLFAFFGVDESVDTCECGCRHALDQAIISDISCLKDQALKPVYALVERLL